MLELDFAFQRDDFSLKVKQNLSAPITGIFGASGSGKTTLLSLIAGLLKPQQGLISLNKKMLFEQQSKTWVPAHKRHIGLVFQDGQLLPHLSVRQNLLYGFNNIQADQRRFSLENIVSLTLRAARCSLNQRLLKTTVHTVYQHPGSSITHAQLFSRSRN